MVITNSGKAAALIIGSLYFYFMSKNMNGLFYVNTLCAIVSLLLIHNYFPESPKFYHMRREFNKARDILQ